ncbi:MAG TPA: hypothetical protein VMZ31_15505 [Phycisphaerae bacterium]|nr:hypothetical protein [Phycisphaerae bacterium]
MEPVTVCVAATGVVAVLLTRPIWGLIVYLAVLLWYPSYLVFGPAEFYVSAQRAVGIVLLAKHVANPSMRARFRWCQLDVAVVVYMALNVATLLLAGETLVVLRNRAGFMMDTVVVYFLIRLIVVSRSEFMTFVAAVGVLLLPLGVLGGIEMCTGWNPFAPLLAYCPWYAVESYQHLARSGYHRAVGTTAQPIVFGLIFATLLPLVLLLRRHTGSLRRLWWLFAMSMALGAISSVSSTPMIGITVAFLLVFMARFQRWAMVLLILLCIGCAGVEFASNRHFWTVLTEHVAFDRANAWYRGRLVEAAVEFLPQYWAYGYGYGDWGWGPWLNSSSGMDVCNEYVWQLGKHGVFVLMAFLWMLAAAAGSVRHAHCSQSDRLARASAWALGSSLVTLMIMFFGVSLFSTMLSILYCILGLCAGEPARPTVRSTTLLGGLSG